METEQSSEVKDQEKSSAEEALEATAGPASETEPMVPLHKHTALRDRAQTAEIAQARAEGQLAAIRENAAAQAPPVISPLDAEIARQAEEGIDEADMTISPRIIKAQEAHNRQAAEQATATEAYEVLHAKQIASANTAKAVHEDWQTVVQTAFTLMTPGEKLDIEQEGDNFGEIAYAKAQEIIARNTESETKTAPEKPSEPEAEKEVPTQDKILADLDVDPDTARVAQL